MKNISQHIEEFRAEFRCSCGHNPFGEHIEPNATYKEMEDFFRKALTEVASKRKDAILEERYRIASEIHRQFPTASDFGTIARVIRIIRNQDEK
jgi:hypothetical protein